MWQHEYVRKIFQEKFVQPRALSQAEQVNRPLALRGHVTNASLTVSCNLADAKN